MNLFGTTSKTANKNNNSSFLLSKSSLSINAQPSTHPLPRPPVPADTEANNIELFLRHRTEQYLKNLDPDTALFFAERLLSEHDSLSTRLLVARCYHQLHQYNRAYHVLERTLRRKQTEHQRSVQQPLRSENAAPMNQLNLSGKTSPFDHGGVTPKGIGDFCYTPIRMEDNQSAQSEMGFAFAMATPIAHNGANRSGHHIFASSGGHNASHNNGHNGSMGGSFGGSLSVSSMASNLNTTSFISTSALNLQHLSPSQSPSATEGVLSEARYFFASICFKLARYDECEEVLLGKKTSDDSSTAELTVPNGVHGIYLLAKVFHKSGRFDLAEEQYRKCIDADSYHFGAIMALSELGRNPGLQSTAMDRAAVSSSSLALQSKHCVVPRRSAKGKESAAAAPGDADRAETECVSLETADPESYATVKKLFEDLSWGYFKLQMFDPQGALRYFVRLPPSHRASAWCLNNVARCYYEMNDYQRAISEWKQQVVRYPYDMKGMDYYSTALWHLRMAKELTLLSQHCSEIDKLSASTWMVMGNCFSLHKSHDSAIRFFQKAYCLREDYAYAHTLAGHEYVVNEDFDAALKAFQSALRIDSRHYNAWYGLATIYQFQQNYKKALFHFNRAREINPNSSVLFVCIASIFKLQHKYKEALQFVDHALALSEKAGHQNLKARLEKANILILTKQFRAAIKEFSALLQIIPNEWKIHFHLGEVYLKCKEKDRALMAFNRALALNPKDKNTIKHAIQNIHSAQHPMGNDFDAAHRPLHRRRSGNAFHGHGIAEEDDDHKESDGDAEMNGAAPMDQDHHSGSFGAIADEVPDLQRRSSLQRNGPSFDDGDFIEFEGAMDRNESMDAVGPTQSNSLSPAF